MVVRVGVFTCAVKQIQSESLVPLGRGDVGESLIFLPTPLVSLVSHLQVAVLDING